MMPFARRAGTHTRATSRTGRTPSSASTTSATTWPSRSTTSSSAATSFAIVDEVDSILVDEARTPLIISGEPETAAADVLPVRPRRHGARGRAAHAQDGEGRGRDRALGRRLPLRREVQDRLARAVDDRRRSSARSASTTSTTRATSSLVNHLMQALKAQSLYKRDVDYVVQDGRGQDRRRVHRPHHGGPALERGPPPGDRGEGGRRASARRTSRSRRSRSRTTSASTRSSPA